MVNEVSLITLSFNKIQPHMCTIVMFARSSNHEQSQRPSFINYDYKGVMCKICSGNLLFDNKDFEYSLIKTKNYFIHFE